MFNFIRRQFILWNIYKKISKYESDYNSIIINPAIGIAIKENSVLGGQLHYSKHNQKNILSNEYKDDAYGYGGGLFFRQYKPLSSRFYLFGEAGAGYHYFKNTREDPAYVQDTKSYSFNINVQPGLTYAVSKRFHLEAALNNLLILSYGSSKTITRSSINSESKTNGISFSTNLGSGVPLSIGFRFVIPK